MENENCIFCKIVEGKIPALKVYEDTAALAFLDIQPSAPGHTMIILKKHGPTILDYSKKELGTLMGAAQKVTLALEKSLKPDSITMGINHREETGVYHLHLHLIPRWKNDGGSALQGVVHNPPKEELMQIVEKIKNSI